MTSRYQDGIIRRYYEHKDTLMVQKLSELVSDLYLAGAAKVDKLWDQTLKTLRSTGLDEKVYARIVAQRDVKALAELVGSLALAKPAPAGGDRAAPPSPAPPAKPAAAPPPAPVAPLPGAGAIPGASPGGAISPDTLKAAFRAFKKRIKLTRLDEESKLGRSPLTGGKTQVVAIEPPREYPRAVWDELVKQGRLKTAGRGFYQIA